MSNNRQTISPEQLQHHLVQRFGLNADFKVTAAVLHAYQSAVQANNWQLLVPFLIPHRSGRPTLLFTHDIDWIDPWHPYALLNGVRAVFFRHRWLSRSELLHRTVFIEQIDRVLAYEREQGIEPIVCIGAKRTHSYQRFGIRYTTRSAYYPLLVDTLKKHSVKIGLHSEQETPIQEQWQTLKQVTGVESQFHRSHFLQYNRTTEQQLETTSLCYDLGNGSRQVTGFINGLPGAIHLQFPSGNMLTRYPMVLMDNHFFDRPYHEVMGSFKNALLELKAFKGTACVLLHPENFVLKPVLWNYLDEIIHLCTEHQINTHHS